MRKRRARASSSAGGVAKLGGSALFEEIHQRIDDLYAKVLEDKIPSGVGAVCNQLLQTKLRALDQQRKTEELEDMTRRIEELERVRSGAGRTGGAAWGS
jgi:hypothetical protein